MVRIPEDGALREESPVPLSLDELAREGARRMLVAALEAEVTEYIARFEAVRDAAGHAQVVRNGYGKARRLTLGCGTVGLRAPRVNDRRVVSGKRQRFTSSILPPYMRTSPKVAEVLPVLYLRGLSTGDFQAALPVLLGEEAAGLSPSTISRLVQVWEEEYHAFRRRDLADREYVYVWADGVHVGVRLEEDRLCLLVLIGARADGSKEVIAVEDGYRESSESWLAVLRDLNARGMPAPVLAIGDRALGFWHAVREVWPQTAEQTCWVHRLANVLDKLPKRVQPSAKAALHEMMYAPTRAACEEEMATFAAVYGDKYPKAVASLCDDRERLLTFFTYPAAHWQHLRTTNPIESTFATVKLRQRVTKGAGSRTAGLAMAFKLLTMAEARWRRLKAPQLVAAVASGTHFEDGILVKTETKNGEPEVAA